MFLALRELAHQRTFTLFFTLNLALGLIGATTLSSLEASIERTLAERSRSFLAADLRVTANRPLTIAERESLESTAAAKSTSELVQLYTMVATPARSRLVEVRAIDAGFPLSGALLLDNGGEVDSGAHAKLESSRGAWVDRSLLGLLGVSVGDRISLGGERFEILDTIARDTGLSLRAVSFGPRIYIPGSALRDTGLIQLGSRVEHHTLIGLDSRNDVSTVAVALRRALAGSMVRVTSHEESAEAISGAYSRVTGYLGAVSLIALCLAGLACAYTFRTYLGERIADLAILMSLGATRRRAQALLVFELMLLGAAAATVALVASALVLPLVVDALSDLLPAEVDLHVGGAQVFAAYGIALLFGPLSCLPYLARLGRLRISELFQGHVRVELADAPGRDIAWGLPAAAMVGALAWWQLGDAAQAAGFLALLVVTAAAVSAAARAILSRSENLAAGANLPLRLALRQLSPRRRASRAAFLALALTALLLTLPAQMRAVLDARLAPPADEAIPSLFLFDIQPDQTTALAALLAEEGVALQRTAPMVRARLDAINGESIAPTAIDGGRRELRSRERMQNRRYNLTYQSRLAQTETLVSGEEFSGSWRLDSDALPEISIEVEFARDLGVAVGDRLRFDVQGVMVEGRIVNLRAVDWNSMQPNFFVSFQPGVLEAAPAVFLASIPALSDERKTGLQNAIVDAFPNVSSIDVSRGVERALGLIDQLQWALRATSTTALLVGFLLVVAIARDEAHARRADIALLKILGARHRTLRLSLDAEFAMLALSASAVGVALALGLAVVLAHGLFESDVAVAPAIAFAVLVALPALTVATARLATRPVLEARPSLSLR